MQQIQVGNPSNLLNSSGKCTVCNSESSITCEKCKAVYSPCQRVEASDFFIHKFTSCKCSSTDSKRNTRLVFAILLPEEGDKPILTQINVERKHYSGTVFDLPELKPHLGNDYIGRTIMAINPMKQGKHLPNGLEIHYRDNFLNDGSRPNTTVLQLVGSRPVHPWRGPIVVTKYKGADMDPSDYLDMSFNDLSDVVDFFLSYNTM